MASQSIVASSCLSSAQNRDIHPAEQQFFNEMQARFGSPEVQVTFVSNETAESEQAFLQSVLPRKTIQYQIKKYDAALLHKECSTCLKTFRANKKVAVLGCGHCLHKECFDTTRECQHLTI